MTKIEKKNDAGNHTPKGDAQVAGNETDKGRQDAPNYDKESDDGRTIPLSEINSANDE